MTRALSVARDDFRRALRNKLAWGALLLVGLMDLPWAASVTSGVREFGDFVLLFPYSALKTGLVLVAVVGYGAVVSERESGTLRMALGNGASRRDVVLGKFLSRTAVVVAALGIVLVVVNAFVADGYGDPHFAQYWAMGAWTLAYGVVWTAVVVGYSAAFASQYRVLAATLVTYAVFSPTVGLWGTVVRPVFALAFTGSTSLPEYETLASAPLWLRVTDRLNPLSAFFDALAWSVSLVGPGTPEESASVVAFGALVFAGFGAVPLVLGLRRFERADLNDAGPNRVLRELVPALPRPTGLVGRALPTFGTEPPRSRAWTVARADLRHAVLDWTVLGVIALVGLLTLPNLATGLEPSTVFTDREVVHRAWGAFLLPSLALAIAVGYASVAGERESGTVGMVLGLGATRREYVLGKLVARVSVVVLVLVPFLLFAELLVVSTFGRPFLATFLVHTGTILVFAVAWTSATVGASAALTSRYRTLGAVFGTFLFLYFWGDVVRPLFTFLFTGGFTIPDHTVYDSNSLGPLWFRYTDRLNPVNALSEVERFLTSAAGLETGVTTLPLALFSLAVVVLFAVIPVAVGARRFGGADLR